MYKRLLTNLLHGKAAEPAVITEITVLQLQNTSSTLRLQLSRSQKTFPV